MSAKTDLRAALRDLPEGFQSVLGATIPAMPSAPSDVDSAIILNGQLAAFLIALFTSLEGLELLEVPLRVSQFVPSLDGLLATSLKESGRNYGDYQISAPVAGQIYAPGTQSIAIEILNGLASLSGAACDLTQMVNGEPVTSRVELQPLEEGSATYINDVDYGIGDILLIFSASFTFQDGSSAVIQKRLVISVIE